MASRSERGGPVPAAASGVAVAAGTIIRLLTPATGRREKGDMSEPITITQAEAIEIAGSMRSQWDALRNNAFVPLTVRASPRVVATLAVVAGFDWDDLDFDSPILWMGMRMVVDDALSDHEWRIEIGSDRSLAPGGVR